jgi:hypothetical protein
MICRFVAVGKRISVCIRHNSQYQQKYAYQMQQSDKACHTKHTPLHTIIYAYAKSSVFAEQ